MIEKCDSHILPEALPGELIFLFCYEVIEVIRSLMVNNVNGRITKG